MIVSIEHSCGHTAEKELTNSSGNTEISTRTMNKGIAYWETKECLDCWKSNKQAETDKTLEQLGILPVLVGSEKQVKWATQIREKLFVRILERLSELQDASSRFATPEVVEAVGVEFFEESMKMLGAKVNILITIQDAKFWIDTRDVERVDVLLGLEGGYHHKLIFDLDNNSVTFGQNGISKQIEWKGQLITVGGKKWHWKEVA